MDSILAIMFGCFLCTFLALIFMELRRIRRCVEPKPPEPPAQS
jgi:hypothetical protein